MVQKSPKILRSPDALRAQVQDWRHKGLIVGFVPTMGALHTGHLSLVTLANTKADRVVASIFVNPTQFAPGEDLDAYPRTEEQDSQKLASVGCDAIYLPRRGDMYADDHSTVVSVGGVANGLETDHRPHFFDGVATIVCKLFNQVCPDVAVFGEKDFQQLLTIRRMVRDLDFPIDVVGAPIARDKDGLALSSRNAYFDKKGRKIAGELNLAMFACRDDLKDGVDLKTAIETAKKRILKAGFTSIDYVALADGESLEVLGTYDDDSPARLLVAAHCEGVRLIDNCAV